jgi:hypothetical protein
MTEYLPIYQTGVSLTRSLPAMESNYGNQTVELSVLQNTELLEADLGNLNLSDNALKDMLTFWFVFGSKWFRFGLPEFKLDPITTTKTNKYAYFKLESNNIYKLFLKNNGVDKRIYLPKNLKIANYTGVIKELSDYTFYLSTDPGNRAVTGAYDLPVIMEGNSLSIGSSKDDKLSNIKIKEILFGEEITPSIKLTNLVRSIVVGGSIQSPPPLPPPPFVGGQCSTPYTVNWIVYDNVGGVYVAGDYELHGPIRGSGSANGSLYFDYTDHIGIPLRLNFIGTFGGLLPRVDITSVSRKDGLPDNCGNLPGYQQP